MRIGDTLGLNDEQTLKGMYDLLNLLPTLSVLPDPLHIAPNDLVHTLVLLDEDEK